MCTTAQCAKAHTLYYHLGHVLLCASCVLHVAVTVLPYRCSMCSICSIVVQCFHAASEGGRLKWTCSTRLCNARMPADHRPFWHHAQMVPFGGLSACPLCHAWWHWLLVQQASCSRFAHNVNAAFCVLFDNPLADRSAVVLKWAGRSAVNQ